MFLEFRASPGTWRPNVKQRSRSSTKVGDAANVDLPLTAATSRAEPRDPTASRTSGTTTHRAAMIIYPFPIRDSMLASIELPADLTRREAQRLAAFLDSLVSLDDPPGHSGRTNDAEGD